MLGIGLPLTFAGQARPATTFLRAIELIPLYATEWLILSIGGLLIVAVLSVLDMLIRRVHRATRAGLPAKIAFAIVIATAIFFGGLTWVQSFRHEVLSWHVWYGILLAWLMLVSLAVVRGWLDTTLRTASNSARVLSALGCLSLVSLPFSGDAVALEKGNHAARATRVGARPNIVLISIDAMAIKHLVPYGSIRPTSPNIAAFASHAMVFGNFYANSNFTTPAVPSILTGVPPWTHRALELQGRPSNEAISQSLPARLHEAGYRTAYFGSNPWAGARRLGFSPYFDHQDPDLDWEFGPCLDGLSLYLPYLCAASGNPFIHVSFSAVTRVAGAIGLIELYPHSDLEQIVGRIRNWLAVRANAPIFMWVHFFPPHDPYAAPEPWLGKFDSSEGARRPTDSHPMYLFDASLESQDHIQLLEARYDESVLYMDHYFGELIADVRQRLGPNTAIILTADHGESFEHGYGGHSGIMLYQDLIHIPLIIELPNKALAGERNDQLASQVDIAPTIAGIANVSSFPDWIGHSLLTASGSSESRTIFTMNFEQNNSRGRLTTGSVAALRSNWKLVRFFGKPLYPHIPPLQTQLFDLAEDPHELKNVVAMHPDIVNLLSAQIDAQLAINGGAIGG